MSIDLNWDTLTTGPDGLELAERIRDFIHSKFQAVPLPRFIKSVTVHDFEFGSIAPELELKDITDPLPDFYEDEESDEDEESSRDSEREVPEAPEQPADGRRPYSGGGSHRHELSGSSMLSNTTARPTTSASTVTHPGGVPGGTSNLLHHFHSHLAPGWSGAQTPLAAMAGAHLGSGGGGGGGGSGGGGGGGGSGGGNNGGLSAGSPSGPGGGYFGSGADQLRPRHNRNPSRSSSISMGGGGDGPDSAAVAAAAVPASSSSSYSSVAANPALLRPILREKHSVSTLAPTSAGIPSRPPTRDGNLPGLSGSGGGFGSGGGNAAAEDDKDVAGRPARRTAAAAEAAEAEGLEGLDGPDEQRLPHAQRPHEPRAEDMQAVFRIRYAGDIKLLLTADILLDYPMPSFVGIPVRLSITGLTFDGVGVLAYIRRRIHFCFLGPEDALAAVGGDDDDDNDDDDGADKLDDGGDGVNDSAAAVTTRPTALRSVLGAGPAIGQAAAPAPAPAKPRTRVGGLLQEVRVESEIGQRQGGKQSLKNVGKVERFVLEQVRRIFEEEFVYPSFWTFLV